MSGLSNEEARQFGLRFGQVAVFAWQGPRWSLLASATDRETHLQLAIDRSGEVTT